MKRSRGRESDAEQLRGAVVDAALSALGGGAGTTRDKRALAGPRALATGAALYTVVRAGFVGGRFVRARRAVKQDATDEFDEHAGGPDPHGHHGEDIGEGARSPPTRPRPKRTPAQEDSPRPSLNLPNRRWSRMAAERN